MKVLILGAGYAVRLYPLTENIAKPLISVGGKTVIERLVEQILTLRIQDMGEILVVCNNKFYSQFEVWQAKTKAPVKLINDATNANEEKLGSIGDILFVLEKEAIDQDLLIVAGDNIFDFDLGEILSFFRKTKRSVIPFMPVDYEYAKKGGTAELDKDGKIIFFEEKSAKPRSTLYSIPIYFYRKEDIGLLKQYIREGGNKDAPGYFLEWLYKKTDVYGHKVKDCAWFDIGDFESLDKADKNFGKK